MSRLQGLVLAGGEGTRLRPFTLSAPKHLIPLLGKAVIEYAVEDLVEAGIRDIGVVIGYLGELLKSYLGDGSEYGAKFTYIVQQKRLGIAHAIHLAIKEGFATKPFVVYLGDNILASGIKEHTRRFIESEADVYIMLSKVKDPTKFGVALVDEGRVVKLVEKPKKPPSDLALVGIYYFRDPDLVEKAYSTLKPSWRGEYEITELIQWFIDKGYRVEYSVVSGWWKDVGTPEGLLEALYLLLDRVEPRIEGEVLGEVMGRVVAEKGSIIEGKVYGPAYIGRGVYIGKASSIEHFVSVEAESKVISGSITRSLILDHSVIDIRNLRLIDSVIGRYSMVQSARELHGNLKLAISDYSRIYI